MPGSGRTTVIREAASGRGFSFIANNEGSAEMIRGTGCSSIDVFPFKSPCARVRQFQFRVSNIIQAEHPAVLISEPPGNCLEVSSPMMNPFCLVKDGSVTLGPLITVIRAPGLLEKGTSNKSTESFRNRSMIDESDAVILTFADSLSDADRETLRGMIAAINSDAKVIFFAEGREGAEEVSDLVFGTDVYTRPLVC